MGGPGPAPMSPENPPDRSSVDRVRPAYPRDLTRLVEFNRAMARETEDKELDEATVQAGMQAVLDDPGLGEYFVAERDGVPVGCLMITREWSDWRNGVFWWIQSVYVAPQARGAGVFRSLYEFVLARARAARDVCGVRLYVERANRSAQAVYRSVGMQASHYDIFELDFVHGAATGDRKGGE